MTDEQLLHFHAETIKSLVREKVFNSAVTFLGDFGEASVSLGSGTCVSFESVFGILTCAHTAVNLTSKPKIGFGIPSKSDTATRIPKTGIRSEDVTKFYIVENNERGPDLAFIQLSAETLSMLKATRVFLNISKHCKAMHAMKPNAKWTFDFVLGSVEDMNFKSRKNSVTEILHYSYMIIAGSIARVEQNDQFDIVTFQPANVEESDIPNGYQGVSGGSFWRFNFDITDKTATIISSHLAGVPFYQSAGPNRSITCHGPNSIFLTLAKELEHQLLR